jgi:hypothetical protein
MALTNGSLAAGSSPFLGRLFERGDRNFNVTLGAGKESVTKRHRRVGGQTSLPKADISDIDGE